MENLWVIIYEYNNGEKDVQRYDAFEKIEYVQGTADDVRKYLAEKTWYDSSNLTEFDKEKSREENCYCPIFAYDNPKTTYTFRAEYEGDEPCEFDDTIPRRQYSFARENDDEICYAYTRNVWESDTRPYWNVWETHRYTAIPTTIDRIIKVLKGR